ncbi:Mitochondrial genome maintenance protein MGM101 [Balamuthia mandrillaris]
MQKSLATGLISFGARNGGTASLLTVTAAAVPRRGWNSFLRTTVTSNAILSSRREYHLSVVERAPRRKNPEAQEGGDPSAASQEGELVREQKEDGSVYERVNLPHEEEGEDSSDEEEEEEEDEDYDEEEEGNEDEDEEAREAEEWAAAQHEVRTRNASDYTEIEGCYTPQSYDGIAAKPFPPDVADVLLEEIHPSWVEIKPDGTIYLPEIFYRRILNTAFGPGGWALMPRQAPEVHEATGSQKLVTREYALYCLGRFVSQAGGEQQMFENIGLSTASESAKSQALMRCCKDLGVASSLWDPTYIAFWKSQFAVGVLCEHTKTGAKKVLWRRKDRKPFGFPWKEGKIMFQGDEEQGSGEDVFTTMMNSLSAPSKKATKADAKKEVSEETEESEEGGEGEEEEGEQQQQKQQQQPTVFDPEGVLPPQLKKYAGKKWKDVVRTPAGRDYLTYLVKNYQGESKLACQKALDWWNEQQNKK